MDRYLPLAPILIVLAFIPDYTLRLHHYLLATAAIPVLSLPNRVSLAGQAFALGLFLDGAGRWGMASILEFTASVSAPLPLTQRNGSPGTRSLADRCSFWAMRQRERVYRLSWRI